MFGISTGEPIPPSYLTDHDAWDRYMGAVWRGLFPLAGLDAQSTVVEIGPGAALKIAYALADIGFRGKLFVVDASPAVIEVLKPKYAALMPEAEVTFVTAEIANCRAQLPDAVDCLLTNHIIDDMIVYLGGGAQATAWSSAYTLTPTERLKRAWDDMQQDQAALAATKAQVAEELGAFIASLAPRGLIMSQYPSSTLYDNGMASLNDAAEDVLAVVRKSCVGLETAQVQESLNAHKNYGNQHIGEHILNAGYWVVSCKR